MTNKSHLLLLCYLYKLQSDQKSHFLGKVSKVWSKELQKVIGRTCKEVKEKHTKKYLETDMIFIRFSGVGGN